MAGKVVTGLLQSGVNSKSVAGSANVTLSQSEYENGVQVFTGALTGSINVYFPLTAGMRWSVYNNTSGSYTLTCIGATGTGVAVTQGKRIALWTDGTNVYAENTDTAGAGFAASGANTDITSLSGLVPGAAATVVKAGGALKTNTTAVGNVGSGEDDLITYSIPASVLATNGDRLRIVAFGEYAANANNKTIKAKYGATTLLDTTAIAANDGDWCIEVTIIRTGATAQIAIARLLSSNSSVADTAVYSTPAETLSGAVTFKLTGEATSDNDIVQRGLIVEWMPYTA